MQKYCYYASVTWNTRKTSQHYLIFKWTYLYLNNKRTLKDLRLVSRCIVEANCPKLVVLQHVGVKVQSLKQIFFYFLSACMFSLYTSKYNTCVQCPQGPVVTGVTNVYISSCVAHLCIWFSCKRSKSSKSLSNVLKPQFNDLSYFQKKAKQNK